MTPGSENTSALWKPVLFAMLFSGRNVARPYLFFFRYSIAFFAVVSVSVTIFWILPPSAVSIATSYFFSAVMISATTPVIPFSRSFSSIIRRMLFPYPSYRSVRFFNASRFEFCLWYSDKFRSCSCFFLLIPAVSSRISVERAFFVLSLSCTSLLIPAKSFSSSAIIFSWASLSLRNFKIRWLISALRIFTCSSMVSYLWIFVFTLVFSFKSRIISAFRVSICSVRSFFCFAASWYFSSASAWILAAFFSSSCSSDFFFPSCSSSDSRLCKSSSIAWTRFIYCSPVAAKDFNCSSKTLTSPWYFSRLIPVWFNWLFFSSILRFRLSRYASSFS